MRSFAWIVLACVLGCAVTSPADDGSEVVKALIRYQLYDEQIPQYVIDEIRDSMTPLDIKVVKPKGLGRVPMNLGAVSPNDVTDELLKEVNAAVKTSGLDPYVLADINIFGMTISLTVGGFDTLHRVGDATMTIYDTYNYEFHTTVQVYSLTGDFAFSFTFLGLTYNAGANAMVDTVDADCVFIVSINPADNATYIHVNSLDSSNIGRISVEVYGLGPLEPFVNVFVDIFMNVFKVFIPIFFDSIFLDITNQILDDLYPPWQ